MEVKDVKGLDGVTKREGLTLRWVLASILVVAAVGAFIRLGFWQLDRLAQRRASNAQIAAHVAAPSLDMNTADPSVVINMEYRNAFATGRYDFTHQVGLRNQVWNGELGIHLLTPLVLTGGKIAVLVDRGWIPVVDASRVNWGKYDQEGQVTLKGVIRNSQNEVNVIGIPATSSAASQTDVWSAIALDHIGRQVPEPLFPVYLQALPDGNGSSPPYRSAPVIDLSDGPHLSYALQWFSFAAMLAIGFPIFLRRQFKEKTRGKD